MSTDASPKQIKLRSLTAMNCLGSLGGEASLIEQWSDGDVLRVVEDGENDFEAHHWLLLKHSLSAVVYEDGDRYLTRVLATRRGYGEFGSDRRQDMTWVTVPVELQIGDPFTIYRSPWRGSANTPVLHRLSVVKIAAIDW